MVSTRRITNPFQKDKLPEMIKYYDSGNKSLREVSEQFNVPQLTIYHHFKKNNVNTKIDYVKNGNKIRKYKIDETYFEQINTRDKAYILGLICADGSIHSKYYQIKLKLADLELVEAVKDRLKCDMPIYVVKKEAERHKQCYALVICNYKVYTDIQNAGIIKNKSYFNVFPSITPDLQRDFIRGFFDGNGCISFNNGYAEIKIISTIVLLEKMKDILNDNGIVSYVDRDKRTDLRIGQLRIRKKSDCINFSKFIYTDIAGQIFLTRKYDKFKLIKE